MISDKCNLNYVIKFVITKSGTMETELEFWAVDEDKAKHKYDKWGENTF